VAASSRTRISDRYGHGPWLMRATPAAASWAVGGGIGPQEDVGACVDERRDGDTVGRAARSTDSCRLFGHGKQRALANDLILQIEADRAALQHARRAHDQSGRRAGIPGLEVERHRQVDGADHPLEVRERQLEGELLSIGVAVRRGNGPTPGGDCLGASARHHLRTAGIPDVEEDQRPSFHMEAAECGGSL